MFVIEVATYRVEEVSDAMLSNRERKQAGKESPGQAPGGLLNEHAVVTRFTDMKILKLFRGQTVLSFRERDLWDGLEVDKTTRTPKWLVELARRWTHCGCSMTQVCRRGYLFAALRWHR